MPRKKKTRQQKIIASLRRQVAQQSTASPQPDNTPQQPHTPQYSLERMTAVTPIVAKLAMPTNLLYVQTSLKKTAIVSLAIIVCECIIFLLFKSHIVRLPTLGY